MAGSDLVQSLTRGMLILEHLAESEDGLTVAQISERLGVSAPTTHNLLRTLAARDYVQRQTRPVRYTLGARLGQVAAGQRRADLQNRLESAMLELGQAMPGVDWVYAQCIQGVVVGTINIGRQTAGLERGRRSPLGPWTSASATAYQAWCTAAEREQFRRMNPFAEYGAGYWRDEAEVDAFLAECRRLGYAAPGPFDGTCRVAIPIIAADGRLQGTLGGFWPRPAERHQAGIDTLSEALFRAQSTHLTNPGD